MTQPVHIPLPTPFSIGPANSYLFTEPEPVLVDCGIDSDESYNGLATALDQHGLQVADLRKILITHAHVDHMGMSGRLVANSDARVLIWRPIQRWATDFETMWAGRMEFLRLTLDQYDLPDLQRGSILDGMRGVASIWKPVPADRIETFTLADQINLGGLSWQVIYAPGHSNTQTCFYQRGSGSFLAADMLLPLTPAPVLEHNLDDLRERERGLPQLMRSYAQVRAMEIEQVYPGHGAPFSDHEALIDRQLARIAKRKAECLALVRAGHHRVGDLVDIMYSHHPPAARFTGLSTLIGYLDLLLEDGLVVEQVEEGKRRYYAV